MSVAVILQTGLNVTAALLNFTSSLNTTANLPQSVTNGASQLGTLDAATLPLQLSSSNWGSRTAKNTNPYTDSPTTGKVRSYDFHIARGTIAPDGYQKEVLLINGQFPGPTIEANWGDTITVHVHNNLIGPEEGTALHWHGLLQTDSPWEDGVPAVQQCPIAPGKSLKYTFKADLYGTSWYHSHYSAQYAGGLFGPMIIHGPNNLDYDIDLGPVLLTDYFHKPYFQIVEEVMGTDLSLVAPKSDNNLINGKMDYNCSLVIDGTPCVDNAGLAKFRFQTGKTHRLRLINAGAEGIQKFSIDGHKMTIIANDFVPIVPYETEIVTLGVGQRSDVIVEASGDAHQAYWMRSTISNCSNTLQPDAQAIIYYPHANMNEKPTTTAWADDTAECANDLLTQTTPFYPITPATTPATTITLEIGTTINSTGHFLWTMNNSSFRADYNSPLLLLAKAGNTSYPLDPEWNVYDTGSNSTIRFIVSNPTAAAHPMHLHGHNMYVLAEGVGEWDGSTVVDPGNPQRRDVQLLQPLGYIVVQIDAANPGVWPFHCHIAWHVSGGLYVNIMERPDDIMQQDIPPSWHRTCRDWAAYTDVDVVDEIDSGL
ncbi:hypothetical protein IMSHALPRED_000159 [Imshaugia aleurites]|uniref:Laccase n=1 Tax=Imshaugia aleurites TaxID=172621 RepID=A0A8H3EGD7_9LECA|nr:hypothetical protein IMSHALPRED_000159 [Imshaugia aleurites]